MSRKPPAHHVSHERWLVSYADFITLLFAFFVVLFASSQADKKKQSQVAAAMSSAFTPLGTLDSHPKPSGEESQPALIPAIPILGADEIARRELAEAQARESLARTQAALETMLATQESSAHLPAGSVTMRITQVGLTISLHEAGFFTSGSAEVRPASIALIQQIAATLPAAPIRIEGHTDNIPIHTAQFASNWELSTARAARIARLFLDGPNLHPADLSAAGYAEFHPVASNDTEAGRSQNRRIDVILLWPTEAPVPPAIKPGT